MKFLVISDTHGNIDKVLQIYQKHTDIDALIHLGDYERDAVDIKDALGCDMISVKGNMDNGYSNNEFKIIETECGKLLLTHGHMQHVKSSLQSLMYLAEEHDCTAALFGHTHMPVSDDLDGLYLINPGSLSLPADSSNGSYAVINTDSGEFEAEIIYYNESDFSNTNQAASQSSSKPKVQGGFLRNLLNNSDRF